MADETQEQVTARNIAEAAVAAAKAVFEASQATAAIVAKDNIITSTAIAILQTEMAGLKTQQTNFETEMNRKMDSLDPKFEKVFAKLDQVMIGRPTWTVSLTITGLFGLCASLIVFIVTHPM